MPTAATTVSQYLGSLPEDRRELVETIRTTINKALPKGYEEGIQYGMIGWYVPHSKYPAGYHCNPAEPLPFIGLGNQKGHVGLYLFCVYCQPGGPEAFAEAWEAAGCKLDMGKSCVRIKSLDQTPLPVIAKTVRTATVTKFIKAYEGSRPEPKASKSPAKKTTKKKSAKKKASRGTG